jgi:hypothetical protein
MPPMLFEIPESAMLTTKACLSIVQDVVSWHSPSVVDEALDVVVIDLRDCAAPGSVSKINDEVPSALLQARHCRQIYQNTCVHRCHTDTYYSSLPSHLP